MQHHGQGSDASSQPTPSRPPAPRHSPDATVHRPRPPDVDEPATRIVGRAEPPAARSQSWVSEAGWARQTETPTSIPPVSAPEGPALPLFEAQDYSDNFAAYSLPEDRFQAPPELTRRPRAPVPFTRIVGWAFAVILLAVAAGVGYVTFIRQPEADVNVKVPVSATASVQVVRGDAVVRQYLSALASGDVDKARSLGPLGGGGSAGLLTRAAYAESLRAAPITDVDVPTTDANATDIPATYKLGGQQISTRFRVRKLDSGSWEMAQTTVTFRMQGTSVTKVPLIVNGVRIDWDTPLELLPGAYTVSTGLPFLTYAASDSLTVLHLGYTDTTSHPVTPRLTEQGIAAFKSAVKTSLSGCVSRKELAPANCPMGYRSTRPVVPTSVTWQLTGDPVGNARAGLVASDQSKSEVTVGLKFSLTLTFTDQGRLNSSPVDSRAIATAVMTVADASLIKVEWRNV